MKRKPEEMAKLILNEPMHKLLKIGADERWPANLIETIALVKIAIALEKR